LSSPLLFSTLTFFAPPKQRAVQFLPRSLIKNSCTCPIDNTCICGYLIGRQLLHHAIATMCNTRKKPTPPRSLIITFPGGFSATVTELGMVTGYARKDVQERMSQKILLRWLIPKHTTRTHAQTLANQIFSEDVKRIHSSVANSARSP